MMQITLLPELRSTLTAAFRVADLVRLDFSHPFSLKVKEEDLIDFELAELIRGRLEAAGVGGKVPLADPELLFLYTLLDLLCKSYFTSFAQVLEREYRSATGETEEAFRAQRDRQLSMAGRLLERFRAHLSARAGFAELEEKLALLEETMN